MAQLQNVNTTDIKGAIRLGCRTMQSVFNADDDRRVAFFGARMLPSPSLSFSEWHSEAHVPGRHLNALLNAEDAAGIETDEKAVQFHAEAAFFSYSGPVPLPLNRQAMRGPLANFCPHNIREGFHALYSLVRYRDSAQARGLAERSIAAIFDFWTPDHGWDVSRLKSLGLTYQECQGFIHGEARTLGPLVKLYRATGHAPALKLAILLREKATNESLLADGTWDPKRFATTHAHSVTCVLSSLAQLAELLGDASLLMRVKAFYDNGLWEMRDQLGWSPESIGEPKTDRGESNNTGDILETALILGRQGFPECYEDAERILRGHLLPSQLRDVSFAQDPPNPRGTDGLRDVRERLRGAWGFPAPYGHSVGFNLDIVGGAAGSLCEAYRHVTRHDATGHWVNLLFDHETEAIQVESPYTHDALRITLKKPGPLFVRIPSWANPVRTGPEGVSTLLGCRSNGYLFISQAPVGQPVTVRFPLVEREMTLSPRVHPRPIRAVMRGDAVAAMENLGADLTFFPSLDEYRPR